MEIPQKIKIRATIWSRNSTSQYTFEGNKITILKWYLHVHCSNIHNSQDAETSKCPSTDEWIKNLWYILTMEYYTAIKKKEIWTFATTWMDLEGLMLTEISQTEKDIYCITPAYRWHLKKWTHWNGEEIPGCQRWGVGGGGIGWKWSMGTNFQLQDD